MCSPHGGSSTSCSELRPGTVIQRVSTVLMRSGPETGDSTNLPLYFHFQFRHGAQYLILFPGMAGS